jgi:type VI secretion system secreted protein VgrG
MRWLRVAGGAMTTQITIAGSKLKEAMFTRMRAQERLGELFAYEVEFESEDTAIDLSGLLSSPVAVKVEAQDGYERYFHGIVCEAEQTAVEHVKDLLFARYRVRLVPKPWLLGSVVDCRIFKNQSVTDIVKAVLAEVGYTDVKTNLSGSYATREYCVQYREDGLNFISRLLQQEGIYYYFTHTASAHTMVLADGVGSHAVASDFDKVPYHAVADSVLRAHSAISEWASLRGVDGTKVQLTDYNPLKPKASLLSRADSDGHGAAGITVFDYPGTHDEADLGKHYAQMRAEALSASRSRYAGSTDACSIEIGALFTLTDYPRGELNQEYLVVATSMHLEAAGYASGMGASGPAFNCHFEALESKQPYRSMPSARKPTVVGLQTAIVTGSETDEDIAVDKYGRVQVNFHWNMPDKPKADCSCPVRVASPWAGKSWGAVSLPRIGQEVVVSFIEGDPDRPLIVASVYNADNMPPYSLPDNKTQSGIKSRSLLGGTDDFNELRMEDKKGEEDFFIHAQKDMHEEVENDHVVAIDHDETITIKNDQTRTIKHDQTLTVENDQTETIKHDRKATVQNDDKLDVTQNGTTSIGQNFKLTAGTELKLVCGPASITMSSDGSIQIKGMKIEVSADTTVAVKGNAGATLQSSATVDVKGTLVNVNGTGVTSVAGALVKIG